MVASLSLTPPQFLFPHRLSPPSSPHLLQAKPLHKSALVTSSCSSSLAQAPTHPIVVQEAAAEEEERSTTAPTQPKSLIPSTEDPKFRGCKTCGKEEIEKGCNGEGRIQGGIATVPGFGWWPIKAFRPCPGFVASGGRYRRKGQSMDEVAFGRGGRDIPTDNAEKLNSRYKSSKEVKEPKKLKR